MEKMHEKISVKEEFEDTKGIIRIPKSKKDRQHNGQKKKYNRRRIYKPYTLNTHCKPVVNSGAPDWSAVPTPLVAPVVLI